MGWGPHGLRRKWKLGAEGERKQVERRDLFLHTYRTRTVSCWTGILDWTVRRYCKLKQNANEGCNSCASLAGLVLSFIASFILLVIAPLTQQLDGPRHLWWSVMVRNNERLKLATFRWSRSHLHDGLVLINRYSWVEEGFNVVLSTSSFVGPERNASVAPSDSKRSCVVKQ